MSFAACALEQKPSLDSARASPVFVECVCNALWLGNPDFSEAAAFCMLDCGRDFRSMGANQTPAIAGQDDDSDSAASEVLLFEEVLIRGYEDFKPGSLRGVEQIAVVQRVPTAKAAFFYCVCVKE